MTHKPNVSLRFWLIVLIALLVLPALACNDGDVTDLQDVPAIVNDWQDDLADLHDDPAAALGDIVRESVGGPARETYCEYQDVRNGVACAK